MTVRILHGSLQDRIPELIAEGVQVDAIVTDPPYELGFMGKKWDGTGVAFDVATWHLALQVLKPGGHLIAFGGTRVHHRLMVAIEDAGFELRDVLMWVYSSGFPKSMNSYRLKGEHFCDCESTAKREVRPMRNPDVSAPMDSGEGRGQVLQPGMSEQGASTQGSAETVASQDGRKQSSLEGRSDAETSARELCASSVRAGAGVGATDGAEGRVCDGASTGDGGMGGADASASGDGSSHRSRATAQQQVKSGTVAGQQEPQVSRAWKVCGGCGKPIISDGLGTALKPAWEPIILARKPLAGNVAENMRAHGVGMLDIDGCRIEGAPAAGGTGGIPCRHDSKEPSRRPNEASGHRRYTDSGGTNFAATPGPRGGDPKGRWPANVAHDGSPEVVALFPSEAGAAAPVHRRGGDKFQTTFGAFKGDVDEQGSTFQGDAGSAARFFKTCELDDTEWLLENLPISPALIAAGSFSLSRLLDAIAQSDAATLALPAGTQLSACPAPSMSVTPKESRSLAKAVIAAILTIGPRCLREWRHERLSPSGSVVEVAATREPTGIMTITASRWKSDGYAVPVTFNITPLNLGPGAKDSSARFKYCAKADRIDRNEGCEHLQAKPLNWSSGTESPGTFQAEGTDRTSPNHHPTVKPTDLMRWLVRMVTPKGGLVLDCFGGSGSTGKAAVLEGRNCILIEREAEYIPIIKARLAYAQNEYRAATAQAPLFAEVA